DWRTGILSFSDRARLIHGITNDRKLTLEESLLLIDHKQREQVSQGMKTSVAENKHFMAEHLIHPLDGQPPKWIRSTGKATYNDANEPVLMTGTILDITEE